MKKIMIISPQLILPPSDGGKKSTYYLLKGLTKKYQVYYVMGNCKEDISPSLKNGYLAKMDGLFIKRHRPSLTTDNIIVKCIEGVKWLLSNKPRPAQTIENKNDKSIVTKYIIDKQIDSVILITPYASEYVDLNILKHNNIKIILREENIESKFVKELYDQHNIIGNIETKRVEKYEKKMINRADEIVCISPEDCSELIIGNANKSHYIPVCFEQPPLKWSDRDSDYILFSGALSFVHNHIGIIWFLKNVFEEYKKFYPKIKLKITGNVHDDVKKEIMQYNDVEFTGFLDEDKMKRMLSNCLFMIAPIITGSGVKIKLIEALSMGIPVVATEHCEKGIPLGAEQAYLVAKQESDFLAHMKLLTSSKEKRENISKNAVAFFEKNYNVDNIIKAYYKII